jgi:hypothetical protein
MTIIVCFDSRNLTAQVEQAQDKKKFVVKVMSSFFINQILPQ